MFNEYMKCAIDEAKKSLLCGDIPVGAVIVKDGSIIAKAHNLREKLNNPLCHAEIIAINQACALLDNWRLCGCDMYVTLEPCPMCTGAILQSRIRNVYFGAFSKDSGCMGTVINLPPLVKNTEVQIYGGIMEDECSEILDSFFKSLKK